MATNRRASRDDLAANWPVIAAGVLLGAVVGVVAALLLVHGDRIAFGDLPTWLAVVAATWAGFVAFRQLRDQQAQIRRVSARQDAADNLLSLQLAKAGEQAASAVRIQLTEIPLFAKLIEPLRVGGLVNAGGVPIRDVAVRARVAGRLQPTVDLIAAAVSAKQVPVLGPGAVAFFSARTEGADAKWCARFTDVTGQAWEVKAGGEPVRVAARDW